MVKTHFGREMSHPVCHKRIFQDWKTLVADWRRSAYGASSVMVHMMELLSTWPMAYRMKWIVFVTSVKVNPVEK